MTAGISNVRFTAESGKQGALTVIISGRSVSPRHKKWLPLYFKIQKKCIDFIPIAYISLPNHPTRGAFCRTLLNVGWRRRPLLRLVTAGPGGPGQPSAGIMTGRPSGAGRGGNEGGRKPAG